MRATSEHLDALKAVPLLSGLSDAELEAFLRETQEEFFRPSEVIVKEGDSGGRFFVILTGNGVIDVGGKEIRAVGPGSFFGEMGVIDEAPRSATVKATSDVKALSIARWNFLSVLENNWSIASKVMIELCRKVRNSQPSR